MADELNPTYRCRAAHNGVRCDYRGTHDQLNTHAGDVGHARCIVAGEVLTEHERRTCARCTQHVRADLDGVAIAYAHLERVIAEKGDRAGGGIPGGNALVYLADGSLQGGGPDEWLSDPTPVIAVLESNERVWRREFGHAPAAHMATVRSCLDYLRTWNSLAARQQPDFDDYAAEIRQLRVRLEHCVALACDPEVAPIPCGCGGRLEQVWVSCRCAAGRPHRCGLSDNRTCRDCGTAYKPADYLWRLRMLTEVPGWVSVDKAAERVDRPAQTIWDWQRQLLIPSACNRFTQRVVVELAAVEVRSDEVPRVTRRTA